MRYDVSEYPAGVVPVMYDELVEEMRGQDTPDHPGLLIALWPPAEIADSLAVDGGEPAEDIHLTLAYCPDADPDQVQLARLITGLASVAQAVPPLEARVSGFGVFEAAGGPDGKDVLYASVDAPKLDGLRMRVCEALRMCGVEKSTEHGYTPHMTLEYVPVGADKEGTGVESVDVVDQLFDRTGPMDCKFDRLVLARREDRLELPLTGTKDSGSMYESLRAAATAVLMESTAVTGQTTLSEYTPGRLVEAPDSAEGSKWRVLLIKAGTSANRVHYPEDVLRRAAPLFEGTRAYADHPTRDEARNRPERSVRDIVGWYDGVEYDSKAGGLTANFNVLPSAGWLREGMMDAHRRGKPDLFGFSINAQGAKTGKVVEGGYLLGGISAVRSTDVVTVPGAGGRVLDVLESASMDPELREALDGLKVDILGAVRPLLEAFGHKGGGHRGHAISSQTRAKISATLKAKHGGNAVPASRQSNIVKSGDTPKAHQTVKKTAFTSHMVAMTKRGHSSGLAVGSKVHGTDGTHHVRALHSNGDVTTQMSNSRGDHAPKRLTPADQKKLELGPGSKVRGIGNSTRRGMAFSYDSSTKKPGGKAPSFRGLYDKTGSTRTSKKTGTKTTY